MTSPQGPVREERWQLDAEGARLYCIDDLSDCLNLRDLAMDRKAVADYLNALEREREAYRQALEEIRDLDSSKLWPEEVGGVMKQMAAGALALSSAGREANT